MPNIRQNVQSLVKTNDPFRDKKIVVSKRRIVPIGSEEKDKIKRSLDFTPFGAIKYMQGDVVITYPRRSTCARS